MTYNFSSCIDPCTSARKSLMIDPRHHHKFNPWCHNFDPSDYNRFNPYDNGLELNIQFPDINIPSCPPAPACPLAPACPPCPSYPQPKPDTDTGTKPKVKEPLDFSKLSTRIDILTDDIVNARTEKPTGLKSKDCAKIIMESDNNLEIKDGKIVGKCYDNTQCDDCVKAINSSILSKENSTFFSDYSIPTLEGNVYIL